MLVGLGLASATYGAVAGTALKISEYAPEDVCCIIVLISHVVRNCICLLPLPCFSHLYYVVCISALPTHD